MSVRGPRSDLSSSATDHSRDLTDAIVATPQKNHDLSPASSTVTNHKSLQLSDVSTRSSRYSYADSDRRTSSGLLLGSIFRKRDGTRRSPRPNRKRDSSGDASCDQTVNTDLQRAEGQGDNILRMSHSEDQFVGQSPNVNRVGPARAQTLDPEHLVRVALDLSKGRKRHASTSIPIVVSQDARRVRSTGSAFGPSQATTSRQSTANLRLPSGSMPASSMLANDGETGLECSQSTLLRVAKAQAYLEIADQYRRLMENLSTSTAAQTGRLTQDLERCAGRAYNPMQALRNRMVRQRERMDLQPTADLFRDPVQVTTFVDDVEMLSQRGMYRNDHDLLHLPRLPQPLDATDDRSTGVARMPWTNSVWSITPMDMFADTVWAETSRNKSLIEDRFGVPLHPVTEATIVPDEQTVKAPPRSMTADTSATPRTRHLWSLRRDHRNDHKSKHLFKSPRKSQVSSGGSSRSSSRESERVPLHVDKNHHRPRHGSTTSALHLTQSPEDIAATERFPSPDANQDIKHGKAFYNMLERKPRHRSKTHSRQPSASLSSSIDETQRLDDNDRRTSVPSSFGNTDDEVSETTSAKQLANRRRGHGSKLKVADFNRVSTRDFAEDPVSHKDPSLRYQSSLESVGSSDPKIRDSPTLGRNGTAAKLPGRVTRNVSALMRHGRIGVLRKSDTKMPADGSDQGDASHVSDTDRPLSRLASLSNRLDSQKSQLSDSLKRKGASADDKLNRPRYHVPLPSFRRVDGTGPNVSASDLSRIHTTDSYAGSERTKHETDQSHTDPTAGRDSRQGTHQDSNSEATAAPPADHIVKATKSDIHRARTLFLCSIIKAKEILRQADTGSGIFTVVGPNERASRSGAMSRQHIDDILRVVGANLSQVHEAQSKFEQTTMSSQRSQLERLRDDGVNSLTNDTIQWMDEAETLIGDMSSRQIMAVKKVNDKIEDLMRLQRRELRWLRRLGFAVLEQMVLGLLWIVWLVVIAWKLVKGIVGGVYGGARWLMSL